MGGGLEDDEGCVVNTVTSMELIDRLLSILEHFICLEEIQN